MTIYAFSRSLCAVAAVASCLSLNLHGKWLQHPVSSIEHFVQDVEVQDFISSCARRMGSVVDSAILGSALGLGLLVFDCKDTLSAKGLMLIRAASAIAATSTSALDALQHELQHSSLSVRPLTTHQLLAPAPGDETITRRMPSFNVANAVDLVSNLRHGNTIVITQNIVLTSTLTISSGTITVSALIDSCWVNS